MRIEETHAEIYYTLWMLLYAHKQHPSFVTYLRIALCYLVQKPGEATSNLKPPILGIFCNICTQ